MIWTVISFNHSTEKIQCDLVESSMDGDKAYADISKKTPNLVMSITKGSHAGSTFIPDVDLTLTRAKYNKKV
jgi:hypothetical protein